MTAPVVAVVGGGQLARMMTPAATALGLTLRVLVESEDASATSPAHEYVVGAPSDPVAIARLLAVPRPIAITWEHEHIPAEVFAAAQAVGVRAEPGIPALRFAQDKIEMRTRMDSLGLPGPAWKRVNTLGDVDRFVSDMGGRAVLKTARGGYDGKGVRVISSADEARDWVDAAAAGGPEVLVEELVAFDREVAALVARRPSGEVRTWPMVESIQRAGVCAEVIAPAPHSDSGLDAEARQIGELVATELGVVGVLAVEMFEVDGRLLINELAMRPHNSGHWTIDGSVTSQFEQHLRAVADLPLGDTSMLAECVVMANVLGGDRTELHTALPEIADAGAKVHLYCKEVRPGRKVGHVTVADSDLGDVVARARAAAAIVRGGGS